MTSEFLIIKTSSLGDIIQSFGALDVLYAKFPNCAIDWIVEERFHSLVAAHPLVRHAIAFDRRKWWRSIGRLRNIRYDAVFDLQGNCKSGLLTFLSRGKAKVGFGLRSVREWPNLLATRHRFDVPRTMNIRLQYIQLIQRFLRDETPFEVRGVKFNISSEEQEKLRQILSQPVLQTNMRVMVCPGAKWANKQLPIATLIALLVKIRKAYGASFLLMWGGAEEKELCKQIQAEMADCSSVVDRLSLPTWQNLMGEIDLVLAVDSSALHLCATTATPSFSLFGPTMPEIFKPPGERHCAIRGACPYGRAFDKQCPILRTCPTGACIRQLQADQLFGAFANWWKNF